MLWSSPQPLPTYFPLEYIWTIFSFTCYCFGVILQNWLWATDAIRVSWKVQVQAHGFLCSGQELELDSISLCLLPSSLRHIYFVVV